jgi:hypothetical protein
MGLLATGLAGRLYVCIVLVKIKGPTFALWCYLFASQVYHAHQNVVLNSE